MTDQTEVSRRLFLAEPGEKPILTTDPVEYIDRFERFLEATGIAPERLLSTPLVNIPLPVATKTEDGTVSRWAGINPAMMWLPLFWLPAHLALRYRYRTIDAATGGDANDIETESDEVWAMRVMLELTYSGLYSPEDGTWVDVLALYDLDISNPVDQARVQMWLAGASDEVLDSIDLSERIVHAENPEWALESARQLADVAVPAQWSLSARGITVAISQQLEFSGDTDTERRKLISVMGDVARNALSTLPPDPDSGVLVTDVLEALSDQARRSDADSSYLMDSLLQLLAGVSDDYSVYVDAVLAEPADVGAGSH